MEKIIFKNMDKITFKNTEKITFKNTGGYGPDLEMTFEIDPDDTDMEAMIYYIRMWLLAYGFSEKTINEYMVDTYPEFSHWKFLDK